jgi:hypothetical protein
MAYLFLHKTPYTNVAMAQIIANFPFWSLEFDENGRAVDVDFLKTFIEEVSQQNLTDLFIFSHGWNNDLPTAMKLYKGLFQEIRKLLDNPAIPQRREAIIGTAGIIWPSIKWPDQEANNSMGGAAGLDSSDQPASLVESLSSVYKTPAQQHLLSDLLGLLAEKSQNMAVLDEFKRKVFALMNEVQIESVAADSMAPKQIDPDAINTVELFENLAVDEPADISEGGAAGLFDMFSDLWKGAKSALRVTTYWTMKERAGVVGQKGLGPLIDRLHKAVPNLNIYLIGHSFGARLVSYALKGMRNEAVGQQSPVKLLYLLQGAFSHFAFADSLPFDTHRKGDLDGMAQRVNGPLVATFSEKDLAVANAYRIASFLARQDASGADDLTFRWQGMGFDGAQAVKAAVARLGVAGTLYQFEKAKWLNLDGNTVITEGELPSGAHSDIIHPHTAWVAISAAGIK